MPSLFGNSGATRPNELPYHTNDVYDDPAFAGSSGPSPNAYASRQPVKSLVGTSGFLDEDDEVQMQERRLGGASRATGKIRSKGRDIWQDLLHVFGLGHPKDLTGERTIYINDMPRNDALKYCNNYVSTGKYNLVTFLPKFLAGE